MSELRVSGVRLDTFLSMPKGHIINAVPEAERGKYHYWRAAHVGKLGLNLLRGRPYINAGERDRLIFFSGDYNDGPRIADNITRRRFDSQWRPDDAARFEELAGVPAPEYSSAIVLAARYVGRWSTSKYDPGWGYCTEMPVGFHEIDPYSLAALEEIFDADLLTPPDDIVAGRPLPAAPKRPPIVPASASRPVADSWYPLGQRPLHAS